MEEETLTAAEKQAQRAHAAHATEAEHLFTAEAYKDSFRLNTQRKLLHDLYSFRATCATFNMSPEFRRTLIKEFLELADEIVGPLEQSQEEQ